MPTRPTIGMVLAAGLGTRMRAANSDLPKPLVPVAGRPLIDYALDALVAAGVETIVVNVHYMAAALVAHLDARRAALPRVIVSHEETRLETGGGVANALPHLGDTPFFVLNSDSILAGAPGDALKALATGWRDKAMDARLLVCPAEQARGFDGAGDFFVEDSGKLRRRRDASRAPFIFTGAQILHHRLFAAVPAGPYSLNRHYDEALATGRLHGAVHDDVWLHVGSPEGLAEAEGYFTETA